MPVGFRRARDHKSPDPTSPYETAHRRQTYQSFPLGDPRRHYRQRRDRSDFVKDFAEKDLGDSIPNNTRRPGFEALGLSVQGFPIAFLWGSAWEARAQWTFAR
jgi:hypothetical protein